MSSDKSNQHIKPTFKCKKKKYGITQVKRHKGEAII